MQNAVEGLLERYPAATLQDIYKTMFQDRFGVAHLLSDRGKVREYIEREMRQCAGDAVAYLEPCGWRGDYVRVDLRAVRDEVISLDELTDAFMRSAEKDITADSQALEEWQREWAKIVEVNYERLSKLEGFRNDSTALAEMITQGQYVVHHSRAYNEAYAPHYRIIASEEAEALK